MTSGIALLALGGLYGLGTLWVVRKTTDQGAIRSARKRLQAHLLELRLFVDEPAVIWRAQRALIRGNLRFCLLLWRPLLILALPTAWLLIQLDDIYGWAPLPVGRPAIVTVQMDRPLSAEDLPVALDAPPEIAVETPPVRVLPERQISWRIRPLRQFSGKLQFRLPGRTLEKFIVAGTRSWYLAVQRDRPPLAFLFPGAVRRVEVSYPGASVRVCGLALPWLAWFLISSMASAWLLRRRLRVSL